MITKHNLRPWQRHELTYCSNVHPAETVESLNTVIAFFMNGVRLARNLPMMGTGLWLSDQVSMELATSSVKYDELVSLLASNNIKLFTLNGFPFGNFHAESVKERVYTPDWSQLPRYNYTRRLAEILAACLPDDMEEGTISTLPLGFRYTWTEQQHDAAMDALCRLAGFLADLYQSSGRSIRVCLEMEPDCVLETTEEMIHFFQHQLPAKALALGISENTIRNHLGVCFDVCHQAVMFEDVDLSMARLLAADIVIGKIQISSALELKRPAQESGLQVLHKFAEQKYLHQVRTLENNKLIGSVDLAVAFETDNFPTAEPWRVHFHVPIQATTLERQELDTTQGSILKVLDFLKANPECHPHLEVETYTWQVLPVSLRPQNDLALINGLTAELSWLEKQMSLRGLLR